MAWKLADDKLQRLCSEYAKGRSLRKISSEIGVDRCVASRLLQENGIEIRPKLKITKTQQTDIVRRYRDGEPSTKLASEFGVHPPLILNLIRRSGQLIRTMSEVNRRCELDESAFDDMNCEAAAYWVGMMITDGSITTSNGSRYLRFGLSLCDLQHVEAFRSFLKSTHVISIQRNDRVFTNGQPLATLSIRSDRIVDALAKYGVVPRKSLVAAARGGLEGNRHFWRGVVDGDGSLSASRGLPVIGMAGSEEFCHQFRKFIIGHYPKFTRKPYARLRAKPEAAIQSTGTTWSIDASGKTAQVMIDVLYGDCTVALARKWDKARYWMGQRSAPPRQLELLD